MGTIYIYHILGEKIGATRNLKTRMRHQNNPNFIILEEHTDPQIAGDREQELQKQYGYRVDRVHYATSVSDERIARITESASIRTEAQKSSFSSNRIKHTTEHVRAIGSIGGTKQSQRVHTCPNCNKQGKGNVMFHHHFDKCKNKIN
jgi:hypothetical protein